MSISNKFVSKLI